MAYSETNNELENQLQGDFKLSSRTHLNLPHIPAKVKKQSALTYIPVGEGGLLPRVIVLHRSRGQPPGLLHHVYHLPN